MGNVINATYYGNGLRSTTTDGRDTTTAVTYDTYGNPQTTQTAGHPTVTYAYDAIGRMTGLTDQVNASTGFTYDKRNLLLSKTDPLTRTSTFTYDDVGRPSHKTDRQGSTIIYGYTPSDKLAVKGYEEWYYDGEDWYLVWVPLATFTYNQLDNLTSMQDSVGTTSYTEYDAANRLKSMTDPYGMTVSYQYDAAGNVTQLTYPGNKTVTYTYDALNRLDTVTNWLSQTATYHYDAGGRLDYLTHFNGLVTDYGYDNANRLTSLENKNGSTVFAGYTFTLDGNGNRTQVVRNEPLTPAPENMQGASYTYNTPQRNRLLSSTASSFGYDNEGQLSSGYSSSYAFDYEHRLTAIGSTYQFSYDGRGNRRQAVRPTGTTRYIYDAAGNVIAEADGDNNITSYYIYGQGLLAMVTAAGEAYFYHYDATGSTIAMTNSSGDIVNKYSYDPFGNITQQVETSGLSQPFKYVGQYGVMAEENSFYYMRARYYDPKVGRFISEDPIGFDGGDVNLSNYVSGNPIMNIDPSGLDILVSIRKARGFPFTTFNANHVYLWSEVQGRGLGTGGSSGSHSGEENESVPGEGMYVRLPMSKDRENEIMDNWAKVKDKGL